MALDPKVKTIIEILLKDKGTRQAVVGMAKGKAGADKLTDGLRRTERQSDRTESKVGKLGQSLTRWLGVAVLGRLAVAGVQAFATVERGLNAIGLQMDTLGIKAAAHMPRVQAFLESLEKSGVNLEREAIPAFQQFLGLTRDVEAAMFATKIAAGVAETGMAEFRQATTILSNLLSGRVTEEVRTLGVNIQDLGPAGKDAAKILETLSDRFLTMTERTNDAQSALDGWSARLSQAGRRVSAFFADLAKSSFEVSEKPGGFMRMLRAGFGISEPEEAEKAGEEVGQKLAEGVKKGVEEGASSTPEDEAGPEDGRETALGIARKAQEDLERKLAEEAAAKRLALEQKAENDLLAQRIAMAKEGSEERFQLELQSLRRTMEMALQQENLSEQAKAHIRATFRIAEQAALADHLATTAEMRKEAGQKLAEGLVKLQESERDALAAEMEARIALEDEDSEERLDLEKKRLAREMNAELAKENQTEEAKAAIRETYRLKDLKLEQDLTQAKIDLAFQEAKFKQDMVQQSIHSAAAGAQAIFGRSKALAIALATLDAYLAIQQVWADPSLETYQKWYMTAAVAAQVFANLAQIYATNLGGGGGRGFGGGRGGGGGRASKYAAGTEWPPRDQGGVRPGSGSEGGSTTIDNRSTSIINISGTVLMDRQGERKLARIVERAQRRDRARKIR